MSEPTNGIKVRTGLPKEDGLRPLADQIVGSPTNPIVAVIALRVDDIVSHVQTDTATALLNITRIEADLTPDEEKAVMEILARAQERRTGNRPMLRLDGETDDDDDTPTEEAIAEAEAREAAAGPDFSDADRPPLAAVGD